MTDNEIIKALECCSDGWSCKSCAFDDEDGTVSECTSKLAKAALDLIHRQQEQIKALITVQETLQKHFAEEKKRIVEQLEEAKRDPNTDVYAYGAYKKAITIVKGVQNE